MYYRIASDVALEFFGDKAVVLLAMRDKWIVVNRPAAELMEIMMERFADSPFSLENLTTLLIRQYNLTQIAARKEADKVVSTWKNKGIIISEGQEEVSDERTGGGNIAGQSSRT